MKFNILVHSTQRIPSDTPLKISWTFLVFFLCATRCVFLDSITARISGRQRSMFSSAPSSPFFLFSCYIPYPNIHLGTSVFIFLQLNLKQTFFHFVNGSTVLVNQNLTPSARGRYGIPVCIFSICVPLYFPHSLLTEGCRRRVYLTCQNRLRAAVNTDLFYSRQLREGISWLYQSPHTVNYTDWAFICVVPVCFSFEIYESLLAVVHKVPHLT